MLSFASATPHGRIAALAMTSQGLTCPLFYQFDCGVCSMPSYTWDGIFCGQPEDTTNDSALWRAIHMYGSLTVM